MKTYLPVQVEVASRKEIWQLDISKLGLKELVELKKELCGLEATVRILDGYIYNHIEDRHLYNFDNVYVDKKEAKRTRKLERSKKMKTTFRKGRR